jgi:hypothetical protein
MTLSMHCIAFATEPYAVENHAALAYLFPLVTAPLIAGSDPYIWSNSAMASSGMYSHLSCLFGISLTLVYRVLFRYFLC